jgi:hypothetical protein
MKLLFFAPHTAIWVHAFPEALVAESLQRSGHEVVYVTCGEILQDECVSMHAYGLDSRSALDSRRRICRQCQARKHIIKGRLRLHGYDLSAVLQEADFARVANTLSGVTQDNYLDLTIDAIPVGRLALYELLLRRKKGNLRLSQEEWQEYRVALRGALLVLFAARRILDRERPDRVLAYNSLYSVNNVFLRAADTRGIPTYFMHAGGNLSRRLQTLMLGRESTVKFLKHLVGLWPRFRDRPCPAPLIEEITQHFLALFRGQSVFAYSSPAQEGLRDVRARFGIRSNQRLLVAAMSSPDELFAARCIGAISEPRDAIFPTQLEWIRTLVDFVATRSDCFLLIRVHPREFPNKREGIKSEHAELLEREFNRLPVNAAVNWPYDNVSLYELAKHADLFLNAWSSVGKEMSLLGIPVVCYSADQLLYPADLNYLARTPEEFIEMIERGLREGRSMERSRQVFRWLAVEYGYGLIDISDGYQGTEQPVGSLAVQRLRRLINRYHVEATDCRRRPARLAQEAVIERTLQIAATTPLDPVVDRPLPNATAEEEENVLRAAMARLSAALDSGAA